MILYLSILQKKKKRFFHSNRLWRKFPFEHNTIIQCKESVFIEITFVSNWVKIIVAVFAADSEADIQRNVYWVPFKPMILNHMWHEEKYIFECMMSLNEL